MGSRRFQPLILCVLALTAVVVARLFQLQVLQHEAWAREAVNLVRTSSVVPYRRGAIVDRQGRALVQDEYFYRVEFRYRDFRRGHPLGQVAHAWSSLELRPVPLDEALEQLLLVGPELVQLTHAQLDAFAAGGALETEHLHVGPAPAGRAEYRQSRRADLRFYISRLLQFERRELLDAVRSKEEYPSMLDYALRKHSGSSLRPAFADRQALLADLVARLEASVDDLRRLADELHAGDLGALVSALEGWRREVEDATAGELFREAAGFSLGRVAPSTVADHLDLDWVAVLLRWDPERLADWIEHARAAWFEAFDEYHRKRLAVLVELGGSSTQEGWRAALPEIVTGFWAERFVAEDGQGRHPLEVFDQLDTLLAGNLPRHPRAADLRVLPFEEPGVRYGPGAGWEDLARLELWALAGAAPGDEPAAEDVRARAALWQERNRRAPDRAWIDERTVEVVAALERRFQGVLAMHLDELSRAAGSRRARADGRFALSEGRLDRAEERAHSVLKDRGSRPFDVERDLSGRRLAGGADGGADPGYRLIHLITRYPEAFAGFGVRDATRRYAEPFTRGARGVPYAGALVGSVRAPGLRDLLEQRPLAEQLNELRRRGELDEEKISWLVRDLLLVDEHLGGDGVEGHLEDELSGANGYRARRGMQELLASGEDRVYYQPPEDGQQVVLTIDRELQRVAQETLAHPAEDPDPLDRDYAWLDRPTGAIVLARVEGDVLAAASYPDYDRSAERGELADRRDWNIDRTLTAVGFQPPGSVFKPFVAAWALDRAGLDPAATMVCDQRSQGPGAGWETLRCHKEYGHGEISLHGALMHSCNGYFAWLGEQLDEGQFQALAALFGFGQATGVRVHPDGPGLREHTCGRDLLVGLDPARLRMAGNGLSVINATPMQVARAYAGLATGRLPEMRLVDQIGERAVEHRSRPVGLSEASLDLVRSALHDVANVSGGSAYEALNSSELGFHVCAKTGSADIDDKPVPTADGELRVRKHTWVAAWFPPEHPVAVLVVFVDDTLMTSSRTAVWIARQYLQRPEVQAFVRQELGG